MTKKSLKKYLTKKWKECNCIFFIFLLVLCFFADFSLAQQVIQVKSVIGTSFIHGDISPNMAKDRAINDAKLNALRKAGLDEYINTYQELFTSQKDDEINQFFSSGVQSEIRGVVKDYVIVLDTIYCKSKHEIVYQINIDATIIKYNKTPDEDFSVHITDIKPVYATGDKLQFVVESTKDCYLTIFNIIGNSATMLYPNNYESRSLIDKNKHVNFPIKSGINYPLYTDKETEDNRLIFVFTKKEYPVIKFMDNNELTMEDVFSWIYSINPDMRTIENVKFTLYSRD
mgnify:CR=1 FL=1